MPDEDKQKLRKHKKNRICGISQKGFQQRIVQLRKNTKKLIDFL